MVQKNLFEKHNKAKTQGQQGIKKKSKVLKKDDLTWKLAAKNAVQQDKLKILQSMINYDNKDFAAEAKSAALSRRPV